MFEAALRRETLAKLRSRMRSQQGAGGQAFAVSTCFPALNKILPDGGLPNGGLMELVSDVPGMPLITTALQLARAYLHHPGVVALLDPGELLNPASLARSEEWWDRLIVVRPGVTSSEDNGISGLPTAPWQAAPPAETSAEQPEFRRRRARRLQQRRTQEPYLWSLEQIARSRAVRFAIAPLPRTSVAVMRRLQLAVETSGVTLCLLRAGIGVQDSLWSHLRLRLSVPAQSAPADSTEQYTSLSVTVEKTRGSMEQAATARIRW